MKSTTKWAGTALAIAACSAFAAGCGSSSSSSSSTATPAASSSAAAPSAAALGTVNKATGTPITLGLLNLETGPVTFPEYRQAAEAAVSYINAYKGGIGGHPVKLATCATDGQPSTSSRCASQVLNSKPVAILGGADTGAPGAFPVYSRKNLAYLGGIPFTPVESNAPNAAIFVSVSTGDNAAMSVYAAKTLGVKKASVIYTDDTQGKATGLGVIVPTLEKAGVTVKAVPVSPSAADLSSAAASAVSNSPDLVYVNSPNACPALLKALQGVGNTAKIAGIDPCTSPPALKAAGAAANNLYFAQPFDSLDSGTPDANLMLAATAKYAPKTLALDSIAQAGFSSVMNVQAALNDVKSLTTTNILAAVKNGKSNANFLAHNYDCNGKQLPGNTSICNAYQRIKQVQGSKIVTLPGGWVTGAAYFTPAVSKN